jgi:hypothetical protein
MNNNLEFENENPSPDSIEDNHPRTNYGEGFSKQETLEEAAQKVLSDAAENYYKQFDNLPIVRFNAFIAGAKWQAEQNREEIGLLLIELNHTKTLLTSCEKALEERDKQIERMYSEEEVNVLLNALEYFTDRVEKGTIRSKTTYKMYKDILEQFKKKQS